jgi:hypothetical protein
VPPGAGQRDVSYSDYDDTVSENSSNGRQHDFFDSDSESDKGPGKVLENTIDKNDEQFDHIVESEHD